ncbi:class I SAM-dependent methyltransferase [Alphaproteobacteria bacterium]|nr:class I SAM-dependent methyltransferase [Alphaproteobacteria bacterium]
MGKTSKPVKNADVRNFWEDNPVAASGIAAEPGTKDFYARFDTIREADDCEPYAYSNLIHGYSTSKDKKVLDVGCGNGYVLSRYGFEGAEVYGVDITWRAIDLSRQRFKFASLQGNFQTTDGESLQFEDNFFDIACSMGVLHHIGNPRPMVDEMFRVLKPGGKIILMLYHRFSWKAVVILRLKRLCYPNYWGKSQQEALNMNDGEGCPLALVYSKAEARELLYKFEGHIIRLNQLSWKQLLLVTPLAHILKPLLPRQSDNVFARILGWNLYIEAKKPDNLSLNN